MKGLDDKIIMRLTYIDLIGHGSLETANMEGHPDESGRQIRDKLLLRLTIEGVDLRLY